MSDRKPPLVRDLSSVKTDIAWKDRDGSERVGATGRGADGEPVDELAALRARVDTLTDALEDVVAIALSGADYKERAVMMHRRAVAALTGVPVPGPPAAGE